MISNSEREVLRECLSECPIKVGIGRQYFTKEDICSKVEVGSDFGFNSFKRFLTTRTKAFCDQCNEPFSPKHKEVYRTNKTVYTLDPAKISKDVIQTASGAGPLEFVNDVSSVEGIYRAKCKFGEHNLTFEFFSERDEFLQSSIDPFELEFPVLLRRIDVENHQNHQFIWEELLSERFGNQLSSIITEIKSKTTAVFAEYNENFVANHRTEIKKSLRDYFTRSGYSVYTEIAEHCPELEQYGIETETADYVCVKDDEKLLVAHGPKRDGWYMQRFVRGELTSIENEPIFKNFQKQIDEKIRRYKRISGQLGSAPQFMRGLGGVIAVVTVILAALNSDEIAGFAQSLPIISTYSSQVTILVVLFNTAVTSVFLFMLVSPYLKEKFFSWKMNSCGADGSRIPLFRHSKYFLE